MFDIENKIKKLKDFFSLILSYLSELNDENFNYNLNCAKEMMENVQKLKKELKSRYSDEELEIFEQSLTDCTKQISNKFDSIITSKRLELEIVAKKIKMVQNQKKLLNYSR